MVKNVIYLLIGITIAAISMIAVIDDIREKEEIQDTIEITEEYYDETTEPLTFADSVYAYILKLRLEHPDIVFRQAVLESGNFTSKLFTEHNNMFGMRVAKQRPTVASGEWNNYSEYDSWEMSIIDYALLQGIDYHGLTEKQYLMKLKKNYAQAENYDVIIQTMN